MNICPNCSQENNPDYKYCSNCGQKTQLSKLHLGSLIVEFFQNFFNIEGKIWKSLRDIWKPAKLAQAYINGEREKYYLPTRFFLVVLFIFLALLINSIKTQINKSAEFSNLARIESVYSELEFKYDSLSQELTLDSMTLQTFKDSLFKHKGPELGNSYMTIANVRVNHLDFFRLTKEELIAKSGAKSYWSKLLLEQTQKIYTDLGAGIRFVLGNVLWAVVFVLLMISFFYKIIYLRKRLLFVEHFIFHLFGHIRFLILLILGLLAHSVLAINATIIPIFLTGVVYLFLGMIYFYKEKMRWTIFKFLVSSLAYLFILISGALIIFFISMVLF